MNSATNPRLETPTLRHVAGQGVRQFLDLGAGIPTVGPTHEVARSVNPDARAMYVDIEPVAVEHSKLLLEGDGTADGSAGDRVTEAATKYATNASLTGYARNREQFAELLRPVELIEPGIVWAAQWRPEDPEDAIDPQRSTAYAAVGRKPATAR